MGKNFANFSQETIGRPAGYEYPVGLSSVLENTDVTTTTGISSDSLSTGTGTVVTSVPGYISVIYEASSTFSCNTDIASFDMLIIGGGGGSNSNPPHNGGQSGGGAGGFIYISNSPTEDTAYPAQGNTQAATHSSASIVADAPYTITIGSGGGAQTKGGDSSVVGTPFSYYAEGGGAGTFPGVGKDGGSGGGAYGQPIGVANSVIAQGNPGAIATVAGGYAGGGGGGAGGPGSQYPDTNPAGSADGGAENTNARKNAGGDGLDMSIGGSLKTYAAGGGGAGRGSWGYGGSNGIGGSGQPPAPASYPGDGTAARGSGGGGLSNNGAGGVVIIRLPGQISTTTQQELPSYGGHIN